MTNIIKQDRYSILEILAKTPNLSVTKVRDALKSKGIEKEWESVDWHLRVLVTHGFISFEMTDVITVKGKKRKTPIKMFSITQSGMDVLESLKDVYENKI